MKSPARESLRDNARPVVEENSLERARERMKELAEINSLSTNEGVDKFWAPRPPEGWSYEWKTKAVFGKEDPAQMITYYRTGWQEVPLARHPEMMLPGDKSQFIERDGMILMERPAELTERVRNLDLRRAREQITNKKQQLQEAPAGQFQREGVKLNSSFEPIPVPKD